MKWGYVMKRRVFYSFHYDRDNWRAGQVRNIGVIEGNRPATDNDWEAVKKGGDRAITRWIADQMDGRSCTVALVGTNTADRKWIKHEIVKSWGDGMGVAGIHIHELENADQQVSAKGRNPFDVIGYGNTGEKLSSIGLAGCAARFETPNRAPSIDSSPHSHGRVEQTEDGRHVFAGA